MYRKIDACRTCGNPQLALVTDLGEQYLTGVFPAKPDTAITKGPLRLVKCHGGPDVCGLLQLEHNYDLGELYGENYGYHSSLNQSMVRHLKAKVDRILGAVTLAPGDFVIDIGSNDGTTLGFYPDDLLLVGVDPTGKKFHHYYKPHVKLLADFFSGRIVAAAFPGRKAKVITSFSMLYDLEQPQDFFNEIAEVLDGEGIWVAEQSYMPTMLEQNSYDTICHEHLEYYGIRQLAWMANRAGLKVVDFELNDVNGGSCSVTFAHKASSRQPTAAVGAAMAHEEKLGLDSLEPYLAFTRRSADTRTALLAFFEKARAEGKKVCGLGASTKGNVILQYCGLGPDQMPVIGEVNPDKFDCYAPGSWIPIADEREVLKQDWDYLVVLPWHFRDFFVKSPSFKGRKLVFPLPTLTVVQP